MASINFHTSARHVHASVAETLRFWTSNSPATTIFKYRVICLAYARSFVSVKVISSPSVVKEEGRCESNRGVLNPSLSQEFGPYTISVTMARLLYYYYYIYIYTLYINYIIIYSSIFDSWYHWNHHIKWREDSGLATQCKDDSVTCMNAIHSLPIHLNYPYLPCTWRSSYRTFPVNRYIHETLRQIELYLSLLDTVRHDLGEYVKMRAKTHL